MSDAIEKYLPIWEAVTQHVSADPNIGPAVAGQLRLATVQGGGEGLLYLAVAQEFTKKLLETQLRQHILDALQNVPNPENVSDVFVLVDDSQQPILHATPNAADTENPQKPSINTQPKQITTQQSFVTQASDLDTPQSVHTFSPKLKAVTTGIQTINHDTMLNPQLTFENFVIGQTNRMAQAASIAVAEAPGVAYRPLFIYGNSGLGKTHLLHAIGNAALEINPNIRVRYVSSEEFANAFINAIKEHRGTEFHEYWRQVDILLIDDIQFMSRAKETLEAFFHTFNTLQNQNKQIVITSDVAPKNLENIEDRLISRFEQGLLTDIQAPERDTRLAILQIKAERENVDLSADVLEFIADNFTNNIRTLEGALVKTIAYANLNHQKEITYDMVYTLLKNQLPSEADLQIKPEKILEQTARFFAVNVDEMCGKKRTGQLIKPRHIAMYLCHELTEMSYAKIGQLFGGRDHTTVLHACTKIATEISSNHQIYNAIEELTERIRNNNN